MIIQCDHCSAKFRMEDSKLAKGPVKVRCAKCKEVFVVQKEEPVVESAVSPQPEFQPSAGINAEADGFSFDSPGSKEDPYSQSSTDFSFDVDSPAADKIAAPAEVDAASEFDWQGTSSATEASGDGSAFDLSAFDASIASPKAADTTTSPAVADDFDFGDVGYSTENIPSAVIPAVAGGAQADDFAMDFGEISFSEQSSDAHAEPDSFTGSSTEEFTVSSGGFPKPSDSSDGFALSFSSDSVQQPQTPSAAAEESESVNFGEFSFGEMDDSVAVADSKPSATPQANDAAQFEPAGVSPEYSEEELPPLSLTSRKKNGSLFPLLVILGAILLIIALAGSGVYFFGGPKAFSKVGLGFLVEWYGDKGADEGNIDLKGVTASYIDNSTAGELFVVRGEAVNNFKKPRASIQIKVSLLGTGGATLVTKSAFCGNSLSSEQLATLPLAKIEEIMSNQFGDSLANLGLKPGGTIPFVVVVNPVPKDATDYNVQVGGSTVATQ